METMIQVNELTKVFKTDEVETWALDKVNIEIGQGEFVAVMGPSGCGKSTLLHILGLLDSPSSGQYLLDGKDVSSCSESKRNELRKGMLGFVFQSFNLIDELTVESQQAASLMPHRCKSLHQYIPYKNALSARYSLDLFLSNHPSHRSNHMHKLHF